MALDPGGAGFGPDPSGGARPATRDEVHTQALFARRTDRHDVRVACAEASELRVVMELHADPVSRQPALSRMRVKSQPIRIRVGPGSQDCLVYIDDALVGVVV